MPHTKSHKKADKKGNHVPSNKGYHEKQNMFIDFGMMTDPWSVVYISIMSHKIMLVRAIVYIKVTASKITHVLDFGCPTQVFSCCSAVQGLGSDGCTRTSSKNNVQQHHQSQANLTAVLRKAARLCHGKAPVLNLKMIFFILVQLYKILCVLVRYVWARKMENNQWHAMESTRNR